VRSDPPHLLAGRAAEDAAAAFLEGQGLRIVARNLRVHRLEIDILAWQGEVLVVCEVRWRARSEFGGALASIDARKRLRLRRAASVILATRSASGLPPCRIDALCADGPPPWRWTWIRGL
jgi:putative endonuclease